MNLNEFVKKANTGADAIKRAPIVDRDTGLRCLRIGDVSNNRPYEEWGFTETTDADFERYKLEYGDVVVARTGNTIGVNCIIEGDVNSVYNNGLIRIKVDETKMLPRYFWYVVSSKGCQDYIQSIAYGTSTQPNMKIDDFLRFDIGYQTIDVQEKIIQIIDPIDRKIKDNKRISDILYDQLMLLFQNMFLDSEHTDWPIKKLGDYLTLERGLSYKGKFLSETDGVPMINLGNILPNSKFRHEKLKFYTGDFKPKVIVKPGDIVIANTDLTQAREVLGSAIIVPNLGYPTVICSHHISIIRDCSISKYFVFGMLNTPAYRERVVGYATGTTVLALPSDTILNCEFAMPPKDLIDQYDMIAANYLRETERIRVENIQLNNLRSMLLPRLMSGEVDVSGVAL